VIKAWSGAGGSFKTSLMMYELLQSLKKGNTIVTNVAGFSLERCLDVVGFTSSKVIVLHTQYDDPLFNPDDMERLRYFYLYAPKNTDFFIDEIQLVYPKAFKPVSDPQITFPSYQYITKDLYDDFYVRKDSGFWAHRGASSVEGSDQSAVSVRDGRSGESAGSAGQRSSESVGSAEQGSSESVGSAGQGSSGGVRSAWRRGLEFLGLEREGLGLEREGLGLERDNPDPRSGQIDERKDMIDERKDMIDERKDMIDQPTSEESTVAVADDRNGTTGTVADDRNGTTGTVADERTETNGTNIATDGTGTNVETGAGRNTAGSTTNFSNFNGIQTVQLTTDNIEQIARPQSLLACFQLHRHYFWTIYVASLAYTKQTYLPFVEVTNFLYMCIDQGAAVGLGGFVRRREYAMPEVSNCISNQTVNVKKMCKDSVWLLYDSVQVGAEHTNEDKNFFKANKKLVFIAVLIFLLLSFALYTWVGIFFGSDENDKVDAVSVGSAHTKSDFQNSQVPVVKYNQTLEQSKQNIANQPPPEPELKQLTYIENCFLKSHYHYVYSYTQIANYKNFTVKFFDSTKRLICSVDKQDFHVDGFKYRMLKNRTVSLSKDKYKGFVSFRPSGFNEFENKRGYLRKFETSSLGVR
jgi:zona occludens toxin (predicted ATPase)